MSLIGKVKKFKVKKILNSGAVLALDGDKRNFFINNRNINKKDSKNIIKEENFIEGRIVGKKRMKNGVISYQVSTKMLDEETYNNENFKRKLDNFLKDSEDRQKTIRKNRERKMTNNRKRRQNY